MGRNLMKLYARKNETITVRCTTEEKRKMKEKAEKRGKSLGCYLLDAGMAGRERNREKDKRRIRLLTELMQQMDACYDYIQSENLEKKS